MNRHEILVDKLRCHYYHTTKNRGAISLEKLCQRNGYRKVDSGHPSRLFTFFFFFFLYVRYFDVCKDGLIEACQV